jgi:trans-2,3-dihydro-3-hydroxyanthranilate isomerase
MGGGGSWRVPPLCPAHLGPAPPAGQPSQGARRPAEVAPPRQAPIGFLPRNLSETAFVTTLVATRAEAAVRVSTPGAGLPFAAHPNVGAAARLAARLRGTEGLTLLNRAGPVIAQVRRHASGAPAGAVIAAPRPFALAEEVAAATIAACAALPGDAVVVSRHAPALCEAGTPFVVAELSGIAALDAAPDAAAFRRLLPGAGMLICARAGESQMRARMFHRCVGVAEDPATGSAACALMELLLHLDPGAASLRLHIAQGQEMGRPSGIEAEAARRDGAIRVAVGGGVVPVSEGRSLG